MEACWYITHRWSVHDDRWVSALESQGFEVHARSLERDGLTTHQVREMIAGQPDRPVLAGPLKSVTSNLLALPNRCVGLSWGFDLIEMENQHEDTLWLMALDHLIVDSPQTRTIALKAGMSPEQVSEIPWGIDLERFAPKNSRADGNAAVESSEAPIVLSLRSLEDLYHVSDLIAAWPEVIAAHPSARLLIGNHGSLRATLERQVTDLGLDSTVSFLGVIPESDLPGLLSSVDLYVSTSPVDGTSVTMLQAMGCEVPVLVADTPGNREWISPGESGFLHQVNNLHHLSTRINDILTARATHHMSDVTTRARHIVEERANWPRNTAALRGILLGN